MRRVTPHQPVGLQLLQDLVETPLGRWTELCLEPSRKSVQRAWLVQGSNYRCGNGCQAEAGLVGQDDAFIVPMEDVHDVTTSDDHESPNLFASHGSNCSDSPNSSNQIPPRSA